MRMEAAPSRNSRTMFWKSIPHASQAIASAAVFSLFASIGFAVMIIRPERQTFWSAFVTIVIYGVFSVGYALLSVMRKLWMLPIWFVLQSVAFTLAGNSFHLRTLAGREELQRQLGILGVCAILSTVIAYILFIVFVRREGNRYFRIEAEIDLAREIHRSLVPTLDEKLAGYEVFGASIPSGEVGGDLVDVVECTGSDGPGEWIGYVADVSGHGVASGVFMAMFKASARSQLGGKSSPGELLQEIHRTLYPMKMPNMFVTAGVLQLGPGSKTLSYSLAGHPPLMRYCSQRREVVEYGSQNLPLGILPEQKFMADRLECDPGDVLLLLTDGFSEVSDSNGAELGLEPLKQALLEMADRPLPEVFASLRKLALGFGRQEDDQTMLLVRRTAES